MSLPISSQDSLHQTPVINLFLPNPRTLRVLPSPSINPQNPRKTPSPLSETTPSPQQSTRF
ncbi:hypothetical protein SK128_012918, partial [Halocaridina rubra]